MRAGIAAVAMLCGLAACSGGSETAPDEGTTSASTAPAASTAADCVATAGEPVQGSPASGTGSSSVQLGPSSAITADEAAREAPARSGKPLILAGTVFANCTTPAAGAVINVWQTDSRGRYGPVDENGDPRCCYLQGSVETDANGAYTIRTIKPGHYRGAGVPPPAHIHLEVHYRSGGLLTEVFFADDPDLKADPEGGVIELRDESGTLTGRFDIVLSER
jgi:protocatechuate 3,4-dioxygenase beta subunit